MAADEDLFVFVPHDEWVSARDLRARVNEGKWFWQRWSLVGFHSAMSRLKYTGFVECRQEADTVEGEPIVRWYYRRRK